MSPAANEDPDRTSSSSMRERRFKLSRACDRCRRRRIRCDEGNPCQQCHSASAACTFEEPGKRTHPHKSKRTATLEDRMHHLETLVKAIPPAVFAAIPGANGSPVDPGSSSPLNSAAQPLQFGAPPPSLHVFPLVNPSTHFTTPPAKNAPRHDSPSATFPNLLEQSYPEFQQPTDHFAEERNRSSLSASYLYFDDEGYTRWQGETSGLPLLDLLVERQNPTSEPLDGDTSGSHKPNQATIDPKWFPDRTAKRTDINPETVWRLITSYIVPELMDSLVQCYLSTSYYILPFLHVPSFLEDYGNPQKWGEPGFGAFIVAICCLASRHMDDPRVRADPDDGISAGKQWFDLFVRLRTLPIADCPTLYTIQADLIAGVYAVGLGRLSKAAALLSESVTVCIDAGLHRSADGYGCFDPIEDEVRKRTFWCVYIWDKQLCAHFGRPPMIRLRDCDVGEPSIADDEYITHDEIRPQPAGTESRMSAFVCALRVVIVLESIVDVPPSTHYGDTSPFLRRAASVLAGVKRYNELHDEEMLLDEIHRSIPSHWLHTSETLASGDVIRITQAERLHCAEQYVRLLIYRHRFSEIIAERTWNGIADGVQSEKERDAMTNAQSCALKIVSAHLHIATKGLMTYYGVHVIHQLTQAGRTLMAILLNCKSDTMQHLIPESLDALRSCVGLLKRFSGRYVCGARSGDLLEEFCRITAIPLQPVPRPMNGAPDDKCRPPWIRPIRKKTPRANDSPASQNDSPEGYTPPEFFAETPSAHPGSPSVPSQQYPLNGHGQPSQPYMDAVGSAGDGGDPGMYLSPEVLSFFDNNPDVSSLFPLDFMPQPQAHLPGQANGGGIGGPVYAPSAYKKINGVLAP
ncbi:hypothetical protein PLICRDRAFT_44970 [Plicaturopsis crispa FD-325 SS-3]|nr:hypothetical protein PLICRDRAFT_44970 [Plicaturopsis crispa FD-325 SS-3]